MHHDAEIPGIGVIGRLAVADLPAHVPLLGDVLGACEGLEVNIEIKNAPGDPAWDPTEAVAALIATAVAEAGWTERVLVSSFQLGNVCWPCRRPISRLALGALWGLARAAGDRPGRGGRVGLRAVHPFVGMVDRQLVDRAHALGMAVNVWTVNAPQDLQAMVDAGVDAVITDRIIAALDAVRAGRPDSR